jgi:hypothetical protein
MKRFRVFALAGLLALPVSAAAQDVIPPGQTGPQLAKSRFAVTPFVGVRVPFGGGDQFVLLEGETVSNIVISQERGGSVAAGLEAEYRVSGPWSLVGSFTVSPDGNDVARIRVTGQEDVTLSSNGAGMMFGKLGVSYRLPEPNPDTRRFHPAGFLVAAPAFVRLDPAGADASWHPALNLGVQATAPIGSARRLAFQLAIDDFITFWDTDDLRAAEEPAWSAFFGEPVSVQFDSQTSNLLVIRVGASFRV